MTAYRVFFGKQNFLHTFLAVFHFLGTRPLTVSLAAQVVVLVQALKTKDKAQLIQSLTLMFALVLAIVSIALRPPSPLNYPADTLGTIASVLFLVPGVQAVLKLIKPPPDK